MNDKEFKIILDHYHYLGIQREIMSKLIKEHIKLKSKGDNNLYNNLKEKFSLK